jgi:hypothetical protein
MPRRIANTATVTSGLRELLLAYFDPGRWRIPGHFYPYEVALKSGGDVVVTSGRLANALERAGLPAGRFDNDGPDGGRAWLLGADDSLTEILDAHVAEMAQADFDELVVGRGPLSYEVDDYDPIARVELHRGWTAAIRANIGVSNNPADRLIHRYPAR